MPGETGVTVVTTLVCSFCFACEAAGAIRAPGIPCALRSLRASIIPLSSGKTCREAAIPWASSRFLGRAFARSCGRFVIVIKNANDLIRNSDAGIPMSCQPGSNQSRQLDASPRPSGPHTTAPDATFFLSTQTQPSAPIPARSRRVSGGNSVFRANAPLWA
jgi:hypothetical protein